jgi:DDE superfamily endonuclease
MLAISLSVLKILHPGKSVELWFEDEARLGLQPTTRRIWAPCHSRPVAPSNTRYEWLYAYAFIHPKSGDNFWLLLPTVNAVVMSIALQQFSMNIDPEEKKMILLVIDGAGFHIAHHLKVPDNITLRFLPSHTPELQPVESAWPLLREATHNRKFETLGALEETLISRCQYLSHHPAIVHGRSGFAWACTVP